MKFWQKYLWCVLDFFYQVRVPLTSLIKFLCQWYLYQQCILLIAAIYCILCEVDENFAMLNNWISCFIYTEYQKLDWYQLFQYYYKETLKIKKVFKDKFQIGVKTINHVTKRFNTKTF